MEQLNKLEIRGNVGMVNIATYGGSRVARFSVATNYAYKNSSGEPIIETTWHNVTAWEGSKGIPSLECIQKGFPIHVIGRLRSQKYLASDGTEKYITDVIASQIEPVDGKMAAQMI